MFFVVGGGVVISGHYLDTVPIYIAILWSESLRIIANTLRLTRGWEKPSGFARMPLNMTYLSWRDPKGKVENNHFKRHRTTN